MLDIMADGRMGLQGLLNEAFTCPLKGLLKAATAIVTATAASRLLPLRLLTQAYYSHYHCCLASSCRTSYRVKHVYLSLSVPISIHPPYLSLSLSTVCIFVSASRNDVYRVCLSVYLYPCWHLGCNACRFYWYQNLNQDCSERTCA